jgi:sugar phosphate isomerase/epimerase
MNRKDFILRSLTAGAFAASGIPSLASGMVKKKKLPVSAHVWVYARSQPEYDVSPILEQIFSDLKYAGFDGVELMELHFRNRQTKEIIAELISRYQIALSGISYTGDMFDESKHSFILEDVENIMENMASVRARTFGVSVGRVPAGRLKTEKELDAQADILKKLIAMGKNRGIVLNLHNHTYEVENNLYDLKGTLERIPDIKLGPDLNWLLRANVDPIWFLKEYKKNIVFLHLRDQLKNGKWPESLGEGDVDFIEIANVLKDIDFSGDVVIELAHERNFEITRPLKESLKMSRDYVRVTMGI